MHYHERPELEYAQVPLQLLEQLPLQPPEHVPLQLLEHPVEHTLPHPQEQLPLQSNVLSAALATIGFDAKTIAPRIGNVDFAAFLKNSRLD